MFDFTKKTNEELEQRKAEILAAVDEPNADIDGLDAEARAIKAELEQRAKRSKLREMVAGGAGTVVRSFSTATERQEQVFDSNSEEYRSAFLKNLRGEDMTDVERRAFSFMTTNTTAPLPTVMQNRIIDLIGEAHPIVADVYTMNSGAAISIPVAKTRVTGAGKTAEGDVANELEITFDDIALSGNDFTATVKLTYKMQRMAIPAFEDYLVSKIADELGIQLAADIVANIKSGMNAANKVDTGISYASICAGFGALKRVGKVVVYGTRNGVYNKIVGMVDANKRPIFQQPITEAAAGVLLGANIKFEDALGDTELLIGDPKKYIQNVVAPIIIENDKDLDTHKVIYSGYTCQEGTLSDDKAFALVSEA